MAKRHSMTPARRAALKKAQLASARKRRGKGKGKLAAANRQLGSKRRLTKRRVIGNIALLGAAFAASGAHVAYKVREEKIVAHKRHSKNIRARGITRNLYTHRGGKTTFLGQRPYR